MRWKVVNLEHRKISRAVISRLPRYHRYLGDLLEEGVERISSNDLSKKMQVTASQIRQDLNNFGGFGQQGYGYNVKYLYTEIGKILGLDKTHNFIIIGAGNLGQALANYASFERSGFILKSLFDEVKIPLKFFFIDWLELYALFSQGVYQSLLALLVMHEVLSDILDVLKIPALRKYFRRVSSIVVYGNHPVHLLQHPMLYSERQKVSGVDIKHAVLLICGLLHDVGACKHFLLICGNILQSQPFWIFRQHFVEFPHLSNLGFHAASPEVFLASAAGSEEIFAVSAQAV